MSRSSGPSSIASSQAWTWAQRRLSRLLEAPVIFLPEGFFESRAFRKATEAVLATVPADPLSTFPAGHPFRPFVLAPLFFGSGCQVAPYSPIQLIRSVAHLGRGLYHIEGGIDALKAIFIDRVKNHCGDFRDKVLIERFNMDSWRTASRPATSSDRRWAPLPNGALFIAWQSDGHDGSGAGIFSRTLPAP